MFAEELNCSKKNLSLFVSVCVSLFLLLPPPLLSLLLLSFLVQTTGAEQAAS